MITRVLRIMLHSVEELHLMTYFHVNIPNPFQTYTYVSCLYIFCSNSPGNNKPF